MEGQLSGTGFGWGTAPVSARQYGSRRGESRLHGADFSSTIPCRGEATTLGRIQDSHAGPGRRVACLLLTVCMVAACSSVTAAGQGKAVNERTASRRTAPHGTASPATATVSSRDQGRPSGLATVPPVPGDIGPLDRLVLTPDGFDSYQRLSSGRTLGVTTTAGNSDANLRNIYIQRRGQMQADEQVCATWSEQQGVDVQQGLALRVRTGVDGGSQAITVTKNIWGFVNWHMNLHLWTGDSDTWRPDLLAQFDFGNALLDGDAFAPLPWRVCARAQGPVITVKAWPAFRPEPAWDDPVHVLRALVPEDTVRPGRVGWYVGHLAPGDFARYDDLAATVAPF